MQNPYLNVSHCGITFDFLSIQMKKFYLPVFCFSLLFISLLNCGCADNSKKYDVPIATDTISIKNGEKLFTQHCGSCHNFRQGGIGPQLAGITDSARVSWIIEFIRSPKELIDAGEHRAAMLFTKYKSYMPGFPSFSKDEMQSLIAFLHSRKKEGGPQKDIDPDAVSNPVTDSIALSGLEIDLEVVGQVPASADKAPLARIVKMDVQPRTGKSFILDLRGKLYQFDKTGPKVYFDIAAWKPKFIHQPGLATGFGSFAFHPDFLKNGLFYTTHSELPGSAVADFKYDDSIKVTLQWVVTEWKTENPRADTFSGTQRELFRANMIAQIHGIQDIEFNPYAKKGDDDYGQLYIGVGDGGSVENGHVELVHRADRIWGTILRINPEGRNSGNGRYGIPTSNPFVERTDNSLKEVYALGFRNPNRITWTHSAKMLVTNIGHAQLESIYEVVKGGNHGWPQREGTFALHPDNNLTYVYSLPENKSEPAIRYVYPVAQYDHDEGQAIAGGYEYTGKALPKLKNKYLFGDIVNGRLFYTDVTTFQARKSADIKEWKIKLDGKKSTLRELAGNKRVDLRFGRDSAGEMYIFTKADGKVYKLVAGSAPGKSRH